MSSQFSILTVTLLVILLRGEACFQKRILDDDGGGEIINPDERCVALPSTNAPVIGFPQFDGGEPAWVGMETVARLMPFVVDELPPVASTSPGSLTISRILATARWQWSA